MKTLAYYIIAIALTAGFAAAQNETPPTTEKPQFERDMKIVSGPMSGTPGLPELGHDWWRNSEIAQKINLSDPQKQQLNQIFAGHRANLIQLRGNVEIEEGKMGDLLDQDQPQQDQVLAEMTQLQSARNAMEKEFTVMSLAFRGALTPDQWKQLQSLTRERNKMFFTIRGPRRPGGDGPQPPPE